jgi:hypothetical protein
MDSHTATLLDTGEVLIAGGYNTQTLETSTRYRPQQDDFIDAGKMTTARYDHAAAILPDGRVLITGGQNETDYLDTTDLFDPTKAPAGAWTAAAPMTKSRWGHTATALNNGEVLVAGGFVSIDSTTSIEVYDPKTGNWKTPGGMMQEGRRYHTATLLKNGKVLFAGGIQGASSSRWDTTYLDSLEIYDPSSGTFYTPPVKMSMKRVSHTATLLPDGKVLIVGGWCWGSDCGKSVDDIYDPVTDTITPLAHHGDLPSSHVAARLIDGRVLVVGDGSATSKGTVLLYDPGSGAAWVPQPDMAMSRWGATATLLKDGSVLVVGGKHQSDPLAYADEAERFVP